MRFTIARRAAFKAAVFGSSLVLLGGAGYAAAQPGTTPHAAARASVTPPPVKKHHPKPKPKHPKKHHPTPKGHGRHHRGAVHRVAPHTAHVQKRASGR